MSVQRIAQTLADGSGPTISALDWLGGGECQGARHHSPQPLLVRPYHLSGVINDLIDGGSEVEDDDLVYLCSTCWDNLTVYASILVAYDGATPFGVRRDFGNLIRYLGDRAWQHYLAQVHPSPV